VFKFIFKNTIILIALFSGLSSAQPSSAADNNQVSKWVETADGYRQSAESIQTNILVKLFKNKELSKEKSYVVYIKPGRKSLVLFKSSGEKGQKVLMLEDKFWMIMPKSRRPIRITPMQKLLGEASTGDIASMSWHDDYDAIHEGKSVLDGHDIDILLLTAHRKGVSYKTIRLFLESKSHKPLKAELYVNSGKLTKIATFQFDDTGEREIVNKMILTDAIRKGRVTEVEYLSITPKTISNKYFNPQFLAKNRKLNIKEK